MQVFYEEDDAHSRDRVHYPVKPFARRGGDVLVRIGINRPRSLWDDFVHRQMVHQLVIRDTLTLVNFPHALAGPRFASMHSRLDPAKSEVATGAMATWSSNKEEFGLPDFTYYDGHKGTFQVSFSPSRYTDWILCRAWVLRDVGAT